MILVMSHARKFTGTSGLWVRRQSIRGEYRLVVLFYSSIHFPPPLVNGCRKVWCSKNGVCKINQYKKIHFLDRPTSGAGTVSLGVGSVHHCGPDWNGSISTGWTGNEIYILYNMMLI